MIQNTTAFMNATNSVFDGNSDVFTDCLNAYGETHEFMMLAEECAELSQAVMKLHRVTDKPVEFAEALDHLAEEMADVRIMLEQISAIFDNDDDVARWVEYKLNRQRSRLAESNA